MNEMSPDKKLISEANGKKKIEMYNSLFLNIKMRVARGEEINEEMRSNILTEFGLTHPNKILQRALDEIFQTIKEDPKFLNNESFVVTGNTRRETIPRGPGDRRTGSKFRRQLAEISGTEIPPDSPQRRAIRVRAVKKAQRA